MENTQKALQDLAKAIENNEIVKSVIVKIELKKPKSSKATKDDNRLSGRAIAPRKSYFIYIVKKCQLKLGG